MIKDSVRIIENRERMYVKLEGVEGFDVLKVFDCGQCFRFNPVRDTVHDCEYSGVAYGRFVSFGQSGSDLYIYNATLREYEELWRSFLGLDTDYGAIREDILSRSENPALRRALEFGEGIRILRQESFEAVISFIISQNNNIPRIKKIIEALCRRCGEPIAIPEELTGHLGEGCEPYSFPTAEAIYALGSEELFALKTGFRAKYIFDAADRIVNGGLDLFAVAQAESTSDAVKMLCQVKGIGPKVASCALLFGFGRCDAFPVDVWIKKVIAKYFSENSDFDPSDLGPFAGVAQQYLFYYERYLV